MGTNDAFEYLANTAEPHPAEARKAREHYDAHAALVAENARLRKLLERALEQSARVHPDFAEEIRAALNAKGQS
jgi:hypothetical protein